MHHDRSASVSIGAFLVVVLVALGVAAPSFYAGANVLTLATSVAVSAIVGLGALVVIATGNIDVSAGAIFGITGVIGAQVALAGVPPLVAVLAAVVAGALLGLVNAVLVTIVQIPSIIATLGTSSIFTGALVLLTHGGAWVVGLPAGYTWFGTGRLLGLPVPIYVALAALVLGWWVLTRRPLGRTVFAVGSNLEAARLAGIRVKAVEGGTFVVNGLMLGLAAALTVARLGQAQTNLGANITMAAITIAVVGGASVFGGTGTVLGISLAAVLVELTGSALIFFHIDSMWTRALQGLFIVAALVVSVLQRRRQGASLRARFLTRKDVAHVR
ncbi:ABC transporter permease [Puerhibacterium puerhi]|uniref:ABC transporter permease n=1 Tax=Puerhibacterium puerhi TaxID=2692623 RepID=UPI00135C2BD8|nr:ABC transporter permease [Puerhibacterium puerhi]